VKKTDRKDAQALALYLEKDLLPEVRMKPKQNRELMHLAETRDLLVKQRSALKGKINNLLAMQGIELKREALSSKIAPARVLALPVSGMVQLELRILVEQIRALSESIAELDERLEGVGRAVGRRRPTTARIREPDQHQGHWVAECNGSTDGDWQDQRLRG
jgi:transposase